MKIRINAKRWDEPIEKEVTSVTLTIFNSDEPNNVRLAIDGIHSLNLELNEEVGETIEILPSSPAPTN